MKKKNFITGFIASAALAASLLFSTAAYAADVTATKDIPVGSSGQMEMVGMIEPTILSVTMPAFVPFSISNNLSTENKVISPRINMVNNSNIPVQIDVVYAKVNLENLSNTTWNDEGNVSPTQIAIGLKAEETEFTMPQNLAGAQWLQANRSQNWTILTLDAHTEGAVYVVGTLGEQVTDNASFSVTPTFVIRRMADRQ